MAIRSLTGRVGRAMLGTTFVLFGYEAASNPGPRVKAAKDFGVPSPENAVKANGAAMMVGGAALALGIYPRAAALGLAASLAPTTLAGHPYWKIDDPMMRMAHRLHAFKNLSLMGGLLAVAATADR